MLQKPIGAAAIALGAAAWSVTAVAAPGVTVAGVSMQAAPRAGHVIARIPAGAPIEVFECAGWCRIGFAGTYGYIPARLISGGYTEPAPRDYYAAPGYPWSPEGLPTQVLPSGYYGYPPTYGAHPGNPRWHYRRGDGAYFEFGY